MCALSGGLFIRGDMNCEDAGFDIEKGRYKLLQIGANFHREIIRG
jgi:hypothetical protein